MLNDKQKAAVESDAKQLVILAVPGSGKTRTLAYKVVHLIEKRKFSPRSIIVTTFTRKAAQELRDRISSLLAEPADAKDLIMGTFHRICLLYLRRFGKRIGVHDYGIIDESDALALIKGILAKYKAELGGRVAIEAEDYFIEDGNAPDVKDNVFEKPSVYQATISSYKSKMVRISDLDKEKPLDTDTIHRIEMYRRYQRYLRTHKQMDYDDILLYTVDLFKHSPYLSKSIAYLLVDECQDTNTVQYELVKLWSAEHRNITLVGDTDQSIYEWRNASGLKNLESFYVLYPQHEKVIMDQNYRSTKNIVASSLQVITQDPNRFAKGVKTSNPAGMPVKMLAFEQEEDQANYIASDIKNIIEASSGLLRYKDFAVLFRARYSGTPVETALLLAGIPVQIVGGLGFFARREIKDLLAYMRFATDPADLSSFKRIVNVPKRGYGKAKLNAFMKGYEPGMDLMQRMKQTKQLKSFSKVMDRICGTISEDMKIQDLVRIICEVTDFESYLDSLMRKENVQNFVKFLDLNELDMVDELEYDFKRVFELVAEESKPLETGLTLTDRVSGLFQRLAIDFETKPAKAKVDAVQMMTVHAAKGTEYPFVYIVDVQNSKFPAFWASNPDEELRILYVAMTRAKLGLSLTRTSFTKRNYPDVWSDRVRCLVNRMGKGISRTWEITKELIQEFQLMIPRAAEKIESGGPSSEDDSFSDEEILISGDVAKRRQVTEKGPKSPKKARKQ